MWIVNPLIKWLGCACIWKMAGCCCPERLSSETTTWLGKDSAGERERGEKIKHRREKEGEWQQNPSPDSALIAALQHIQHACTPIHLRACCTFKPTAQCEGVSFSSLNMFPDLCDADIRFSFCFSQWSNGPSVSVITLGSSCAAVSYLASLIPPHPRQSASIWISGRC